MYVHLELRGLDLHRNQRKYFFLTKYSEIVFNTRGCYKEQKPKWVQKRLNIFKEGGAIGVYLTWVQRQP